MDILDVCGMIYCTLYDMVLYCTLNRMVLYMYTGSNITLSYAVLPEDEVGVDTGIAAITIILMLTVS